VGSKKTLPTVPRMVGKKKTLPTLHCYMDDMLLFAKHKKYYINTYNSLKALATNK